MKVVALSTSPPKLLLSLFFFLKNNIIPDGKSLKADITDEEETKDTEKEEENCARKPSFRFKYIYI
ncbi:MAG: hypothetical protein K5762_03955 [Bacilli bacterium]|nr:hypothetical protein [Bacilli bacterium]